MLSTTPLIQQSILGRGVVVPDSETEVAPEISVVTAVFNVAAYLPDFFDSLRSQTFDHRRLEVILVDDGSTDDSLALCHAFAAIWDGPVHVLTKPNGGQSSARNLGAELASGTWLSFADSDDMLDRKYFEALHKFASRPENSDVVIHAATMLLYYDATGETAQTHSLNFRFNGKTRVVDLDQHPKNIHLHASQTLIRADAIRQAGLGFDERIRPNFEDATFVALLLLEQESARIGFVADASYLYRRRSAQDSTVDKAKFDPRRYTDVLRYGHLAILRRAHEKVGATDGILPRWLQNTVLYDLLWIIKDSQFKELKSAEFPDETYAEFSDLLDQLLALMTNEAIAGFDVMSVPWWALPALLLRKQGGDAHTSLTVQASDAGRRLISRSYLYVGDRPSEHVTAGGIKIEPRYVAEREHVVLNRVFVRERQVWMPAGVGAELLLDSSPQTTYAGFRHTREEFLWYFPAVPVTAVQGVVTESPLAAVEKPALPVGARSGRSRLGRRSSRRADQGSRFANAWAVMDRDTAANDCGEIFYKWLKKNHPEVNSYFVIRQDVPDWARLRAEGIAPIAYGSAEWKELVLNARHMISSQLDEYVINPLPTKEYGQRDWFFTFLQHGVTKDNIFNWFNNKKIDVLITSTQDEYDWCAGPGPSKFGNREVRLTGMPRFDDLLAKAAVTPEQERRYVLIAPTWREYLLGERVQGNERAFNADFMGTDYAQAWNALLHSPHLKTAADAAGATVAFMPHPNIQPYLGLFQVPDHVKILRHEDVDIRDVLARSRMMITDYSSIAFDLAYLHRHVVYFQFDRAEFFAGGHVFTQGYFHYEDDGFGPVAEDLDGVLKGVAAVLDGTVDEVYLERMRRTFPVRDGRSCERTYQAIIEAETPLSLEEASVAAPFDSWETVNATLS